MITSIKKGDKVVCVKDVIMTDRSKTFTNGNVYLSEEDGRLTNDQGDTRHIVFEGITEWVNTHFMPYTYAAVFDKCKAAKDKEEAEPYMNLLRELDKSIGRSTAGGGNYKACKSHFCNIDKCYCQGDPDTKQEAFRADLKADEEDKSIHTQGPVHINLNKADLATIDPNTRLITNIPGTLTFSQFTYLNNILETIKNA